MDIVETSTRWCDVMVDSAYIVYVQSGDTCTP